MKQLSLVTAVLLISVMSVLPVWARTCPKFIKEGKDLLAKAKLSQAEVSKIQTLIDESERLHDGGDHGQSLAKIKEALSLLKKK
jgi:hypothetical protein